MRPLNTSDSVIGGLEEHNSDNVHLESLRNHLKNDVMVCHININSIQNKFEELENIIKKINALRWPISARQN